MTAVAAFGEVPFSAGSAGLVKSATSFTATIQIEVADGAAFGGGVTANRIRLFDASVSGVASVSAVAAFIARMSGAASLAVTVTSDADRIRLFDGTADASVSAVNAFSRIRGMDATADVVISASGEIIGVFVMSGDVSFAINQETLANVLGDAWTDVAEGTETWADQTATGTWVTQSEGAETWTDVAENSVTWTVVNDGGEEWLRQ